MYFNFETMAYATCLVCIFVDVMGQHFTQPSLVPYAQHLGATNYQVGLLVTTNMAGRVISNQFLPWLSDVTSRKPTAPAHLIITSSSFYF